MAVIPQMRTQEVIPAKIQTSYLTPRLFRAGLQLDNFENSHEGDEIPKDFRQEQIHDDEHESSQSDADDDLIQEEGGGAEDLPVDNENIEQDSPSETSSSGDSTTSRTQPAGDARNPAPLGVHGSLTQLWGFSEAANEPVNHRGLGSGAPSPYTPTRFGPSPR